MMAQKDTSCYSYLNLTQGLVSYGVGLALAAIKLSVTYRPMRLGIHGVVAGSAILAYTLPIAWISTMAQVKAEDIEADWIAHCAWWSLSLLIVIGVVVSWLWTWQSRCGTRPSAVLAAASVITSGAHLFALHHAFLATQRVSYTAPVVVALSFAGLAHLLDKRRSVTPALLTLSWLPCIGLILSRVDPIDAISVEQSTRMLGWLIFALYGALLIMTRKKWLMANVMLSFAYMFVDKRLIVLEHLKDYRGWWLVMAAFALLVIGAALTLQKHRYRTSLLDAAE
jgi:hypothetical protein